MALPKQIEQLRERNRILKIMLDEEKDQVKKLKAGTVGKHRNESDLMTFFISCVDEVKKTVQRRKMKSRMRGEADKKGLPRMRSRDGKRPQSRDAPLTPQPVNLSDIKASDRVDFVHKFLATKGVLNFIFENLFGENPEFTSAFKEFAALAPGSR